MSPELWVSLFIVITTTITFLWKWQDRRRQKPRVANLKFYPNKGYFNVILVNNSNYELIIKKAFRRRFWFIKKQLSIGLSGTNNIAHSNTKAKELLGDLAFDPDSHIDFYLYIHQDENISEQLIIFKTNLGRCKKKTDKIVTKNE